MKQPQPEYTKYRILNWLLYSISDYASQHMPERFTVGMCIVFGLIAGFIALLFGAAELLHLIIKHS